MLLGDDPAAYFQGESWKASFLPRAELAPLQLQVAQGRFASLKDRLPPLQALAHSQQIAEIDTIETLGKLLFPQSFYKSYDPALLQEGDYGRLADWLQRVTMRPLGALRGRSIATLDEMFAILERECGVRLVHSSGTTGVLSLFPRGTSEWQAHLRQMRALTPGWTGQPEDAFGAPPFAVVWCGFEGGHSAIGGATDLMRAIFVRRPELFVTTMVGNTSVDFHWFLLRLEAAKAAGLPQPRLSDYVAARIDAAEEGRLAYDQALDQVLALVRGDFRDERVMLAGPPILVHQLVARGLQQGMTDCFTPASAVTTFGGTKRLGPIETLERDIVRFTGLPGSLDSYGMTEMLGTVPACSQGHYHFQTTQLPFVFDLDSGALLPAQGRQTGRLGIFDLMAQSFWGGTLSADKVTLEWEPCACGRHTPHIIGGIERVPDPEESRPPYAASDAAVNAAFEALQGSGG
ncbi:hypothetical protein [Novosphingobium sp. B 225]|uniref:hypothetical protein n=1 Tax=Novosphingobium sp. B 225 TaxID=1961849 RepID=UPI000B4A64BE|nr:hypothetical protein [Novosphingobium sp. B 225]